MFTPFVLKRKLSSHDKQITSDAHLPEAFVISININPMLSQVNAFRPFRQAVKEGIITVCINESVSVAPAPESNLSTQCKRHFIINS